jgi:hypothetical protein
MSLITKPSLREASYMDVLTTEYPNVRVHAIGDGTDYELLVAGPGGDPLPPKAELDLRRAYWTRVNVWMAIKAERDARKANGVLVGTHWMHSDDSSRIQQLALVLFGAQLPPIGWKCLGGEFITMTPAFASQIFQTSAASDIAIFTVAETHKARMNASANPLEYDFSNDWPPTYTGSLLL